MRDHYGKYFMTHEESTKRANYMAGYGDRPRQIALSATIHAFLMKGYTVEEIEKILKIKEQK